MHFATANDRYEAGGELIEDCVRDMARPPLAPQTQRLGVFQIESYIGSSGHCN